MRILGIDPGFERLGIAVLEKTVREKEVVIFSECFKTPKTQPFAVRLLLVGNRISEIIKEYKPTVLAVETIFINTNQKTAMRVAEARGVIIYEAIKNNLEIFEASPPQIKSAVTGDGRADKKQIIKMVKLLVKIKESKQESDDELDAIAIGLTAFASRRWF